MHLLSVVCLAVKKNEGWLSRLETLLPEVHPAHVLQRTAKDDGVSALILENRQGRLSARGRDDLNVFTADHGFQIIAKRAFAHNQQLLDASIHGLLDRGESFID